MKQEVFCVQFKNWLCELMSSNNQFRSSHPEVFLKKGVLKICSKLTGKHPCRSVISIKLLCNFFEITLRYGCYPVNLLHIFGTPFTKNTSGWLLLNSAILFIFFRTITRLLPIMLAKSQSAPAKPASSRGMYFLSCSKLLNIISLHVSPHIISH